MTSMTNGQNDDKDTARSPGTEPTVTEHAQPLIKHLGRTLREYRRQNHLTIAEVAAGAEISRGMLSKIETGQISPSLETLARLSHTLGIKLPHLFSNYDVTTGDAQHIKSGHGLEVVRHGTKRGHTYRLLAHGHSPRKALEPYVITLDDASEVFPAFEYPGTEFLYMLQGRMEYRHGLETYLFEPGDALTFRADIPHGPAKLIEVPIRFLSVLAYGKDE